MRDAGDGQYYWGDEKDIDAIPNKRIREWLREIFCEDWFDVIVTPNEFWWVEYNSYRQYPFCKTISNYLETYFKKTFNTCHQIYS